VGSTFTFALILDSSLLIFLLIANKPSVKISN
jgi:hypothetical protein